MSEEPTSFEIVEAVREHYALAARQVAERKKSSCCSTAASCCSTASATSCCSTNSRYYTAEELQGLPDSAANASFGCGNPLLLAQLHPGEVVLDLGSGAGLDVILSAKRVAPTGKAYGLDMTDEMLELARGNAREAGVANAEFLKGHIEAIPLPPESVDVIISNCVINLSADKDAVLAEAFRVLKPGGRLAVADIVVRGQPLSPQARQMLALWADCVTGALTEGEYRQKLMAAGFQDVALEDVKVYTQEDLPEGEGAQMAEGILDPGTQIVSAFVKAQRPAR